MSKGWEPCPRCGSNRVNVVSKWTRFAIMLVAGIVFLSIGLIIWPLLLIAIVLFIAAPISLLAKGKKSCSDCKHIWKIEKAKNIKTQNAKM